MTVTNDECVGNTSQSCIVAFTTRTRAVTTWYCVTRSVHD